MLKRQVHIFLTAVMFYTRIPCPQWVNHDPAYLNRATVYFPVMGWIVGIFSFAGYALASVFFSPLLAIVLSLIVGVLVTGAFHEDGFADVCDGFGGGWTRDKIMEIMKDSRVGTYGVVGLLLIFGLKVFSLKELVEREGWISLFWLYLSVHSLSRWAAATTIYTHVYSREGEDPKAKPVAQGMTGGVLIATTLFGLMPLGIWIWHSENLNLIVLVGSVYLVKILMARYFQKWIQGYTGDCLGAIQQVSEVVAYLTILGLWKFI